MSPGGVRDAIKTWKTANLHSEKGTLCWCEALMTKKSLAPPRPKKTPPLKKLVMPMRVYDFVLSLDGKEPKNLGMEMFAT